MKRPLVYSVVETVLQKLSARGEAVEPDLAQANGDQNKFVITDEAEQSSEIVQTDTASELDIAQAEYVESDENRIDKIIIEQITRVPNYESDNIYVAREKSGQSFGRGHL